MSGHRCSKGSQVWMQNPSFGFQIGSVCVEGRRGNLGSTLISCSENPCHGPIKNGRFCLNGHFC